MQPVVRQKRNLSLHASLWFSDYFGRQNIMDSRFPSTAAGSLQPLSRSQQVRAHKENHEASL